MLGRHLVAAVAVCASLALSACGGAGLGSVVDSIAGKSVGGGGSTTAGATMSSQELSFAQQVLARVNQERAKVQLPPVAWDDALTNAAYAHAVDMDARNFFDHTNPDGHDPGWRIAAAGASTHAWGENIAMGQGGPQSVMDAWMNSPGHRANILSSAFGHLGIGVHIATDGPGWVQDFSD
jgi:uncharacterized protein YkwD